MNKEVKEAFALRRKLVILEYAKAIGNATEAYHFFEVPKSTSVYNIEGKLVKSLFNIVLDGGFKQVTWDGTDSHGHPVSSGVYFYRMKAGKKTLTKKMVLLK